MIEACQRIESIEFRGRIGQIVEDALCFFLEGFLVRTPHPHEMGQERPLVSSPKEELDGSEMTVLHPVIKETWRLGMSLWRPAGRAHPVTRGWASETPVLIYRETRWPAHTFGVRVSRQKLGCDVFRALG